jgi:hypothetical protein
MRYLYCAATGTGLNIKVIKSRGMKWTGHVDRDLHILKMFWALK